MAGRWDSWASYLLVVKPTGRCLPGHAAEWLQPSDPLRQSPNWRRCPCKPSFPPTKDPSQCPTTTHIGASPCPTPAPTYAAAPKAHHGARYSSPFRKGGTAHLALQLQRLTPQQNANAVKTSPPHSQSSECGERQSQKEQQDLDRKQEVSACE